MELDELKDLWKKNDAVFQPKEESELASMLRGNSKSIVDKLKRSVWLELIFTTVSGIVLLIYALTLPSGALKWTSVSILAIFVAYSFYYVKKIMLLNSFDPNEGNLRVTLENLIVSLSSYLKFYKRSYTLLYPVYFCLALLFGAIERGFENFVTSLSAPKTILYLVGFAAIFYFGSTWLVNWILKKLYGNHLEKLKVLLKDLNS
ncbi:MAG TPA: hypothetical protein VGD65_18240 [Chryseosolibacter sp.]